jgi:uncharacterized protein YkwD
VQYTKPSLATALSTVVLVALLALLTCASAFASKPAHTSQAGHAACLAKSSRRTSAPSRLRRHDVPRRACRQQAPSDHATHAVPATPPPPTVAPQAPNAPTPQAQAAAASRSATIAAVLAAPCANTEATPEADNLGAIRAAILCLINRERAQNGESPLKPSRDLEAAAEEHSQELVADDYFAHVSPSGVTPVDRIRATGYIPNANDGYVIGENLAWGTLSLSTPQAIVSAWIASPEHLANILEAQYTETGIGVAPAVPASLAEGSPGATYAQEFGVIIP